MGSARIAVIFAGIMLGGCGGDEGVSGPPSSDAGGDRSEPTSSGDGGSPDAAVDEPCDGNVAGSGDVIDGPAEGSGANGLFRSFTVHPTNPDILYVGSEANGIFRTTNGGASWERLRDGLRHNPDRYPEIWSIEIAPSNPSVVYVGTVDSPGPTRGRVPSATAGVYKSTDGGLTFRQVNCGLENSRATSIQIDPTNADVATVLIGAGKPSFSGTSKDFYEGGIFRTVDGGATWSAASVANANIADQGWWKSVRRGGRLVTYAVPSTSSGTSRGFLESTDGGATWSPFGGLSGSVVEWDVSTDGQTFLATVQGSFELARSTNGGQSFTTAFAGTVNGAIAMSPANPDIVFVADLGKLRRTETGTPSDQDPIVLEGAQISEIVFAPSNPDIVFVATAGLVVHKSVDAGKTFTKLVELRAVIGK